MNAHLLSQYCQNMIFADNYMLYRNISQGMLMKLSENDSNRQIVAVYKTQSDIASIVSD